MRYKLVFLIVIQILIISSAVHGTDLRGGVVSESRLTGRPENSPGVRVGLFALVNDTPMLVRQTQTGSDGWYYFWEIPPGVYILQINGVNYPITVQDRQAQDIPIVTLYY